jgi:REP-associated tyrosine transposase
VRKRLRLSEHLALYQWIVSHRVIGFLKQNNYITSLAKLKDAQKARGYEYSLWDGHSNVPLITSEAVFMQRVNYIHQNPVRAGLVTCAEDYRWSSARSWRGRHREDEPLRVDLEKLIWRRPW